MTCVATKLYPATTDTLADWNTCLQLGAHTGLALQVALIHIGKLNSFPPFQMERTCYTKPGMAPIVQPPPPTKNPSVAPTPAASLNDIIHKLYDLIHNIALPKTKTAKTAAIMVEALHAACSLATSARMSLPTAHLKKPVLNKVSTQLDAIAAQLAIPIVSSVNGKQSYATALA